MKLTPEIVNKINRWLLLAKEGIWFSRGSSDGNMCVDALEIFKEMKKAEEL